MQDKKNRLITILTLIGMAALMAAYFAPIWWVSLTAPNYPKDAFPDGIRIHFHFDGVYNGCRPPARARAWPTRSAEGPRPRVERYNPVLDQKKNVNKDAEGLDCVHEMNTINHYVGMFPIATGAPVEKPLAKFFFGFFAVMLLGFMRPRAAASALPGARRRLRRGGGWMLVHQYVLGNLESHVAALHVKEAGTFFKEPDKIKVWGDNVRLVTTASSPA
jgi:hypothetical protein